MKLQFFPCTARGSVAAPPSKSQAHRLLIAAALSREQSAVGPISDAEDLSATLDCLQRLGACVTQAENTVRLGNLNPFASVPVTLDCRESGSTLRFLLPLCLLSGAPIRLTGSARLLARPLSVYRTLCQKQGLLFRADADGLTVQGPLQPGSFAVPGNISSQFITGLLFALPLLDGDSCLRLLGPVESAPYLDLTLAVLEEFGIKIQKKSPDFFQIPGNQLYCARCCTVEGDWSNAAPFLALQALGGDLTVTGLRPDSLQGDRRCTAYLDRLQAGFAEIDLSQTPDLGPVLFVAAALLHGGRFSGIRRLRDKESDRIAAMTQALTRCGAVLSAEADALTVTAAPLHPPECPLDACNDHRIAMALSVLLSRLGGILCGGECVRKSFPDYFDVLRRLVDMEVLP